MGCGDITDEINEEIRMKPAVTREDYEQLLTLSNRLITERDEAIREVERLKESLRKLDEDEKYDHQFAQDALDLEKAYEAEKRRTAAYRQVAINWASVLDPILLGGPHEESVDAEAQKLLADSGGEKS